MSDANNHIANLDPCSPGPWAGQIGSDPLTPESPFLFSACHRMNDTQRHRIPAGGSLDAWMSSLRRGLLASYQGPASWVSGCIDIAHFTRVPVAVTSTRSRCDQRSSNAWMQRNSQRDGLTREAGQPDTEQQLAPNRTRPSASNKRRLPARSGRSFRIRSQSGVRSCWPPSQSVAEARTTRQTTHPRTCCYQRGARVQSRAGALHRARAK